MLVTQPLDRTGTVNESQTGGSTIAFLGQFAECSENISFTREARGRNRPTLEH
ncbi:hypothetical protein [Nocardia sp. NPDC004722]